MAISAKIGLRQTQRLAVTQQLLQSIEMLQLSNVELAERISNELLENPVLEEENITDLSSGNKNEKDEDILAKVSKELSGDESINHGREEKETIYEGFSDNEYSRVSDDDRKRSFIENAIKKEETLKEHLISQAILTAKDDNELRLLNSIITSIDDDGFLTEDIDVIAREIGVDIKEIEKAISIINCFDPVGCGVRGTLESLIVQAEQLYPEDAILKMILRDYLSDLEKLCYEKIAKALKITHAEVAKKNQLIHNLDPFPGRRYSTIKTRYIIPDIEVKYIDGRIFVSLNDDWLPKIRINSYYNNFFRRKTIDKNLIKYLNDRMQAAKHLKKSIYSRRETIIKVVTSIMENQREFLIKGVGHLKPLVYSDIAEEAGFHESTISRVVNNKFVQTTWGVFELKYFFTSRLKSNDEEEYSSDEAKNLIRDIIINEDPKNPVTDREIHRRLVKTGINIAMRTVAKYRNSLNIPSSNIRKKIEYYNT